MAKMVLYKIIAKEGKRAGRTMYCIRCSNPYTDNIAEDALGVVCCRCANGMADGLVVEKPKKNKLMKVNSKEIEEKIKKRGF